jgi:hypothetical protein
MNESLIVTLLIINIALTSGALLGVFVVLGMVRGRSKLGRAAAGSPF